MGRRCASGQTQPHGDMTYREPAAFRLPRSSSLSRTLLDSAQPYLLVLQFPSGRGGPALGSEDLSVVSRVYHDLTVGRWTSYQTSLTRGVLTSEMEIMMPVPPRGGGLNELIYVKIS